MLAIAILMRINGSHCYTYENKMLVIAILTRIKC